MIFNDQFFPTNKREIRKMIEPFTGRGSMDDEEFTGIRNMTILDPSAGKGDILDFLTEEFGGYYGSMSKDNLYCIEKEPELKMILQEKEYKVIGEDFLQYNGDYHFDLILMNPPFRHGADHLLKAWEIMQTGHIVCLLNSETLKNPYTQNRKMLQTIIADNKGVVEDMGTVFTDAQRKTGVNVSMVRLYKKTESKFDFKFENVTKEKAFKLDEETIANPIARKDVIGNMILQYEQLKHRFVDYMKAEEALSFYAQGLLGSKDLGEILTETRSGTTSQRFNGFCDSMKQGIWGVVLDKLNIQKFMTYAVRQNFAKFSKNQGHMDFTKENVENLVSMILENSYTILDQAVVDLFDMFTRYWEENRLHIEGWKTNDRWKVNRKVILPNFVEGSYSNMYTTSSGRWNEYSDIDKVMCYLSGKNYDDMKNPIGEYEYGVRDHDKKYRYLSLEYAIKNTAYGDSGLQESEFFRFRCYKKGTLHIEFKDKHLWNEFNYRACDGKQWLPGPEKKAWKESKQPKQEPLPKEMQLAAPVEEMVYEFDF